LLAHPRQRGRKSEGKSSGVRFTIAELPEANELTVDLLAVLAQHERRLISERTKAALAAAKRRG
jgi:DNA invertase Pin-like site-specific DNA recombinase